MRTFILKKLNLGLTIFNFKSLGLEMNLIVTNCDTRLGFLLLVCYEYNKYNFIGIYNCRLILFRQSILEIY